MIGLPEVLARVRRLDELARGLSRELALWQASGDPLLYLERRAYLNAIHNALAALEEARTVLAGAAQRAEEEQGSRRMEHGSTRTKGTDPDGSDKTYSSEESSAA